MLDWRDRNFDCDHVVFSKILQNLRHPNPCHFGLAILEGQSSTKPNVQSGICRIL